MKITRFLFALCLLWFCQHHSIAFADDTLSEQLRKGRGSIAEANNPVSNGGHLLGYQGGQPALYPMTEVVATASTQAGQRAPEDNVVFVGDSLTLNGGIETKVDAIQDISTVVDDGNGGDGVAELVARAATTDGYLVPGETNRLFVWVGVNDLLDAGSNTGADIFDELKAYCLARQAAGWKVSVLTLPRQDGLADATEVLAYNALIRARWMEFADEIVDVESLPSMQDSTDTVYFDADELHLATAGYEAVGDLINERYTTTGDSIGDHLASYAGTINAERFGFNGNTNTSFRMNSNYIDVYANTTNLIRLGNGNVDVNPFQNPAADLRVWGDNPVVAFLIDVSANGGNGQIYMGQLPTSDPSDAGALWNDSGTLKVSAGP